MIIWTINILKCGFMKNRIFLLTTIICFLCQIHIAKAQLIDNKINVYANYSTGMFHGKGQANSGSFVFPSFYSNLNNINGLSIKLLLNASPHMSYGIKVSRSEASDWNYENDNFYSDSKAEMRTLAIPIQFHNKLSKYKLNSHFKFYVEMAPLIGISSFSSTSELFQVQKAGIGIISPTASDDFYFGLNGSTGVEYAFSQSIGMFMSYSLEYNRIKSSLYNDNHFSISQFNAGIIVKLLKDKKFQYKNQYE